MLSLVQFSSVAQSCPTLQPHELQHARPPCPSPTPGVHSNSHPSSWWCHPAISSSVVPFSFPKSLPASKSFPMSQLFAWGSQSTGVSPLYNYNCYYHYNSYCLDLLYYALIKMQLLYQKHFNILITIYEYNQLYHLWSHVVLIFYFNCAKIHITKFTIFTIFKCTAQ